LNSCTFDFESNVGGILILIASWVSGLKTFPAVAISGNPSAPIYDMVGLQILFKYASNVFVVTG
jgi:hypothetical protein